MARIFISHSSQNNAAAIALRDCLTEAGWDDLFLDLDPERGIAAGERWERALHEAANRCEAVVFLVSKAWLASAWCRKELHLADKLNKRLFGVLLEDMPISDVPGEIRQHFQLVNLASGRDHKVFRAALPDGHEEHVHFSMSGLAGLKVGLTKAGLDPRFFAWPPENDPNRPPYRGLRPFEAEDAGIFFGREAPTIEVLDRLRGLSDAAPPRLFVILGASGAGKSSFLRAGLLPRLQRENRHFLPLSVMRPERAALTGETGFVRCLEAALTGAGLKRSRAEVKAAVQAGAQQVQKLLDQLIVEARPRRVDEGRPAEPKLILPIDQGEELFLSEGAQEAHAFLELICELTRHPASSLIVVFTIRSDSFEWLQTARELDSVTARTFSLPPLARGAYQTVIEGPAARLRGTNRALAIEPALTAALLAEIETGGSKDALPLLAFTLERLYLEHAGDGNLKLSEYRAMGGIRGSIEAAVEQALRNADRDETVPKDRAARLSLLRRALIPWLAGIDPETGLPRRRVARMSEIPEEARPLVDHLIAVRLLSTDVSPESGERTVEPAHEALLRQWGLLEGWLEEESAPLAILDGLKRAASEWEANNRDEDWLAHGAGRLEDAEALRAREDFAGMIGASERAYLDGCRAADTARRDKELEATRRRIRLQRGLALVSSLAAVVFAVIGAIALVQWNQANDAREAAELAQARAEQLNQLAQQETERADRFVTLVSSDPAGIRAMNKICEEAIKVTSTLATTLDKDEYQSAIDRFWELYFGPMYIVELHEEKASGGDHSIIEEWMVEYGEKLGAVEGNELPHSSLCEHAKAVADACASHLALPTTEPCRDPSNAGGQRNLSVAQEKVGVVLAQQGNLTEALASYRASLAIAERLAAADPSNAELQSSLSLAQEKVGDVLVQQGNLPEALASYRASLDIRERLTAVDPSNAGWQRDLSISQERVGDVLVQQGNVPEALASYRASLAIAERLAAANPSNAEWQRELSLVQVKVGDVLVREGNLPEALASYRASLAIAERLTAADPSNAGWQRNLSVAQERVGNVLVREGNLPEALASYRASLSIAERLAAANPSNAEWQRGLSLVQVKVGDVLVQQGNMPGALASYRASLAIAERLTAADPSNDGLQRDLWTLHWRMAQHSRQPDRHWQEVVSIMKALDSVGRLPPQDREFLPVAEMAASGSNPD